MIDHAVDEIEKIARALPTALRQSTYFVTHNPLFATAPASSNDPNSGHKHHAYPGGLAVHTLEVLEKALSMNAPGGSGDRVNFLDSPSNQIIITAAIWHDFAKIHEYAWPEARKVGAITLEPDGTIIKTPYKKLIAHVAGSYAEFLNASRAVNLDPNLTEQIGHCILAHHGRLEWHSPVEPQTEEAYILHAADMWSSRFGPRKDRP
jgi:3'-5' exoribonuclease